MKGKKAFLLLATLILLLSVSMMTACGNAKSHGGGGGGGGSPQPTGLSLIFEAIHAGLGDFLWCSSTAGLNWQRFAFNAGHQAVIPNAQYDAIYTCNIRLSNGEYVVFSATEQLFGSTVHTRVGNTDNPVYRLSEADIVSNNMGGGNWQFFIDQAGLINGTSTVDPPPDPGCSPVIPNTPLVFILKSYSNFNYTPRIRFSGDGFGPRVMTRLSANRYAYTYNNVLTDDLYTVNFEDPTTGEYLFDENGPKGIYVVTVNGIQISQLLDDDLRVPLDACGNILAPRTGVVFNFTPNDPSTYDVVLMFGNETFLGYDMDWVGGLWTITLPNIPAGFYEANIIYLTSTHPGAAVWPSYFNGVITINGTTMTTDDVIVYAQDVALPYPDGEWLVYVRANLSFYVLANGSIVGVDLRAAEIPIIIVIPP